MTRQIRRNILMGELGLNKILGALLATALGLFGLKSLSDIVFSSGGEGHHGEEHAEATSMSEEMCGKFAYCIEIAGGSGGGEVAEETVFDLGALLAAADPARGERTFKGQCTTCHTIEDGGSNGTGPNLHGVVGADKGHHSGFSYSAALSAVGGTWTYEDLDHWLTNPSSFARGTSMSFAGLRKDADRMNVIAYLAQNSPNAPAFPAPLAAGGDAPADGAEAPAEGEAAPEGVVEGASATVEDAAAAVTDVVQESADAATDAAEDALDALTPEGTDVEE
ncbi:MAG: cytochrome c family protein [Hyphomonas sp.]|uniref:c-type cytochrome n=1 Tax=Hyphomonas sp. TaxID=87 RepID=UPI00352754B1